MRTIYLDQNKWIELARAALNPQAYYREYDLLLALTNLEAAGQIQIPLTFGNIYETRKIGDPVRRTRLALIMCNLGWGRVFRGRKRRLSEELRIFLATRASGQSPQGLPTNWFVSNNFLEAVADIDPTGEPFGISSEFVSVIERAPQDALADYLININNDDRLESVQKLSRDLAALAARMEDRRVRWSTEPLATRKRAYGALLMIEDAGLILDTARASGLDWTSVTSGGSSLSRSMMTLVPTFDVERELAIRLESQPRPIQENDFRDMSNFVAAIPYSDVVVGETQFINLARQAKLHTKYEAILLTDLLDLRALL